MNMLFMVMFYDGGERSTVTKYTTCGHVIKARATNSKREKSAQYVATMVSIIRNIEEKKLQLA